MTDKWRSQPTAPHRRRESTRGLLEAEFEAALRQVSETLGGLDIVCNNAGITQATPLGDYTPEDFDKVISINIKSVLNGCQAAARLFEAAGTKGVIISTSSMVGTFGQTSGMGYPASKFAMNGIPRSLARELGSNGIRVNAAAPGIPATDMVAALPDEIKPLIAQIPLCRVGEPVDVANAFVFLASDLASYVTGGTLHVDDAMQV